MGLPAAPSSDRGASQGNTTATPGTGLRPRVSPMSFLTAPRSEESGGVATSVPTSRDSARRRLFSSQEGSGAWEASEASLSALRSWALSLGTRREGTPDASELALPPLRPPKEYTPRLRPAAGSATPRVRTTAGSSSAGQAGPTARELDTSPAERTPRFFSASSMKSTGTSSDSATPWLTNPLSMTRPSDLSVATAKAKRRAMRSHNLHSPPREALAQEAAEKMVGSSPRTSAKSARQIQKARPGQPERKVSLSQAGQELVHGTDPLGGGLFGREAAIDPLALRRGLYEAGLSRR